MRKRGATILAALMVAAASPSGGEEPKSPRAAIEGLKSLKAMRQGGGVHLEGPVRITEDSLTYDEDAGVAQAEGNVEIGFGERSMRAGRIWYDSRSGEAEFAGQVRYEDGEEEFSFDGITLNLDKETGVLYNGTKGTEQGRLGQAFRNHEHGVPGLERVPKTAHHYENGNPVDA